MEIFTIKEWEENFDTLFERVENGERIGIIDDNGNAAVMVPENDKIVEIYTQHNEAP